ncbi:hypothetical protein [Mesorhizobium loti]|uniref:ATP-grasp domain-containing protein n=1 Tax=Mesorhizobium loti R88b TaxID=935548 RepID=A0A6M7WEC8_RHILI|nr:hypothetical protein [Mesorhizobium loti]QKD00812.1 hypothetical protein EB235_04350 [Mesorhizobium loti R88b]
MIVYVVTARFSTTIQRLIHGLGAEAKGLLSYITYEEMFFERATPLAHHIFTDFDRLSRYELDCAATVALRLQAQAPEVRILNHPLHALERVPLLHKLNMQGINDFAVQRLDTGARPTKYPAFLRAEDGYGGPETGILRSDAEFDDAIAQMQRNGRALKGRIAVGYVGEPDEKGFYRKYGAFNVGGAIVPQHLMRSEQWVVKKNSAAIGPAEAEEELDFIRRNPHADHLANVFRIGGLDFGRVDYGFHQGRLQVYEINSNPSFPDFAKSDGRSERRPLIRERFLSALCAINTPHRRGRVGFPETRPRAHDLHLPRARLPFSLGRYLLDRVTGRAKHSKEER